jgi:uncharacterized cysteine cluster protein YcgN (CxxCxxCC family)
MARATSTTSVPFWRCTTLADMTASQWESLCDGCGKCCLHKIIDDDKTQIYHTAVACRYLDLKKCRCTVYPQRQQKQPDCMKVDASSVTHYNWLPDTCAYRLLAQGQDLPVWHPLVSGNPLSTVNSGMSVRHWAISERQVKVDRLDEYIINIQPLEHNP